MVHPLLAHERMGTPVEPGEFSEPLPDLFRLDEMHEKFGINALDLLVRHHESWYGKMNEVDRKTLSRALDDCQAYHGKRLRKNEKTSYAVHPFHVALYGARSGVRLYGLIAYLLHDALEDEHVSLDEIEAKYGKKVAHVVRYMSNPKVFTPDKLKQPDYELEKKADGQTLKAIYALPGDRLYDRKQDKKDKDLEKAFYDEITEIKKKRLYDFAESEDAEAQMTAVLGKQFDGIHNDSTLKDVPDEKSREAQRKKIREVSGWAAEKLNPALVIGAKAKGEHADSQPSKWIAACAPLDELDLQHLERLPHSEDNQINLHPDGELPNTWDIFFPYAHFGTTIEDKEQIERELRRQADALGTPDIGLMVKPRPSLLPPGLRRFHGFKVHFHGAPDEEEPFYEDGLLQALKHVHGRLASTSKVPVFADYSHGGLHCVRIPELDFRDKHSGTHAFFLPKNWDALAIQRLVSEARAMGFNKPKGYSSEGQTTPEAPHQIVELEIPERWNQARTIRRKIASLARKTGLAA